MPGGCVVLLTGHPAVGKSTFAPRLAEALGAVCLSKDEVRYRVFDGWQPRHPFFDGIGELRIGDSVFSEDHVVWSVYFWTVQEASRAAWVVAETAMTKPLNRAETSSFLASLDVPVVEVLLEAPVEKLLERFSARATASTAHPVRGVHKVDTAHRLLSTRYEPLLDPSLVVMVDATEPAAIDAQRVAEEVRSLVADERPSQPAGPQPQ